MLFGLLRSAFLDARLLFFGVLLPLLAHRRLQFFSLPRRVFLGAGLLLFGLLFALLANRLFDLTLRLLGLRSLLFCLPFLGGMLLLALLEQKQVLGRLLVGPVLRYLERRPQALG
ncbi:hypothetical protein D9M70_585820 [compost metagenome]